MMTQIGDSYNEARDLRSVIKNVRSIGIGLALESAAR